jgi:mono/diheme cytochrome c family protein
MRNIILLLVFSTSILLTNCVNNVEDLRTTDDIDPEDVSYSDDIQQIFTTSCGSNSGCHINSTTNGVNLSSYTATLNSVGSQYDSQIVVPGNPDDSPLVDKIEANPDIGSRMPTIGSNLTPTEIKQIRAWITGGAQDN